VKTLGSAALSIALAKMAEHRAPRDPAATTGRLDSIEQTLKP